MIAVDLEKRIEQVRDRIAAAAARSGRQPDEVTLLPATKKQSVATLQEVIECGLEYFGENRVQEALPKVAALPPSVKWDFIGGLQSNKARQVVGVFDLIHSVDSLKLAAEINKRAAQRGMNQKILLEINVGGEAGKHGIAPSDAPALLAEVNALDHIEVHGLMTVPPFRENLEDVRPFFRRLREMRDDLEQQEGYGLPVLSMGMTHDFEIAIEEGSTIVRVGTAIFGARQ
ncbi:MAG: YggS family pyridoxal phosphate-dependent enzyme [Verrucomicrobiota bacterium]